MAFSQLSGTETPFEVSVGIEQSWLFNNFMDFQKAFRPWALRPRKNFDLLRRSIATTRFLAAFGSHFNCQLQPGEYVCNQNHSY